MAPALLAGAVELARHHGAVAIEGFPDARGERSEHGERGKEATFVACGFTVVRRPAPARTVMRRELR